MARRKKRKAPPQYKSGPKKGQFKPKSARKKTAVRKTRTSKGTTMARRRRRKSSRKRSRGRGGPSFKKQAQDLMIGGAMYGFATESTATAAISTQLAKVPTIGNRDLTNGLVLYFANKHLIKSKYVKNMSLAALVHGSVKFGQNNFSLSGEEESLDGWDDAIDVTDEGEEISGIID